VRKELSVIVVAYGARERLHAALAAVPAGCELIVVDHGHAEGMGVNEDTLPPGVRLVRVERNRGFAAGCNAGARLAGGDLLLFLNPDAELREGAVEALWERARAAGPRALVGGRLIAPDGADELSFGRRPALRHLLLIALRLDALARWIPALGALRMVSAERALACSPHWVSGALMLLPAALFRELGGFDERFFLYCEDVDLCDRLRALGGDVEYEPRAVADHRGGGTGPAWSAARHVEHWRSWLVYWALRGGSWRRIAPLVALAGLARLVEGVLVVPLRGGRAGRARLRCGAGLIRLALLGPGGAGDSERRIRGE